MARRFKPGWKPFKGGLEAVFKRFDGVVLDVLAGGLAHMVQRHAKPENLVEVFMVCTKYEIHHPQAAALMEHLDHLTDRQIKRALLKRLRAVQQASNKQR